MESNKSNNSDMMQPHVAYIYTFFISVIIVGVIGNALFIFAFSSKRKLLRLSVNVFIFHLGIINLMTVVTITPMAMGSPESLGKAAIRFRDVGYPVSIAIAQHSLSLIAAARWMTVGIRPGKAHQRTCSSRGVCVVLALMWIITVTITVPLWIYFNPRHRSEGQRKKIIAYFVVNILPTFVLVPVFNILTLRIVRQSTKRIRDKQEDGKKSASQHLRNVASVSFVVGKTDLTTARIEGAKIDHCETILCENSRYHTSQTATALDAYGSPENEENTLGMGSSGYPGRKSCDKSRPQDSSHLEQEFSNEHSHPSVKEMEGRHDSGSARSENVHFKVVMSLSASAPESSECASGENVREMPKKPEDFHERQQGNEETKQMQKKDELHSGNDELQPQTPSGNVGHASNNISGNRFAVMKKKAAVLKRVTNLNIDRSEIKIMRLTLATYLLLAISYIPIMIALFGQSPAIDILAMFRYLVPLFPSLVPFIYIFSHRHLRQSLRKIATKVVLVCCSTSKGSSSAAPT